MRAQEERTYESTHMRARISAQRRARICPCAVETHTERAEEPLCVEICRKSAGPGFRGPRFVWKFTRKMPDPNPQHGILCKPAQSKRTWTFHKRPFCGNLQEKMPHTSPPTLIKHRAVYTYRKNPFSVATLFGKKVMFADLQPT